MRGERTRPQRGVGRRGEIERVEEEQESATVALLSAQVVVEW